MHLSEIWHSKKNDCRLSRTQVNNISWWIINVSDRSLINIYIGPAANGIYALACKIPNICASISGVFNVSWQEAAVDMLDSNERDTYYNKVLNQSVSILISVCAGILSFNYLLFEYLFDARYNEAALYSPVLVASVVLGSVVLYFGGIQISFKRTKENGITTVFGAIVNVIFNIVFIPYIGIYAAALSTVIAQVVICILRYLRLRNTVDFKLTRHTLLCIVYFIYMAISCYICHSIIYSIFNIVLSSVMFLYINRGFVRKVLHKFI